MDEADKDKNGKIDFDEFDFMGKELLVSRFGSLSSRHDSLQNQTTHPYGRDPLAEGQRRACNKCILHDTLKGPHAIRLVRLGCGQQLDVERALSASGRNRKQDYSVACCQLGSSTILLVLVADTRHLQTAQVASQQGKYLAKKFGKLASQHEVLEANNVKDLDEAVSAPFRYKHLGNLAYIGNAAVFDLGQLSVMGGLVAMYAWRSVYWSEHVSARTRALLMIDWIIRYACPVIVWSGG